MCSCAEQVDRVRKDDWPVQCWSTERKRRLKRTDGDRMEMRVGGRHGDVRGRETLCHQLPHQSCHTIFFYAGRLPFYKSPGNHDSPIKKAPKPRPLIFLLPRPEQQHIISPFKTFDVPGLVSSRRLYPSPVLQLCPASSATQPASGRSTSTGPCIRSAVYGIRRERVSTFGSAFDLVSPLCRSPHRGVPNLLLADNSTPGTQVCTTMTSNADLV